jgi:hypothetical protein
MNKQVKKFQVIEKYKGLKKETVNIILIDKNGKQIKIKV